jgi:hypothetical protein
MIPPRRPAPYRYYGSRKHKGQPVKRSSNASSIMITSLTILVVLVGIIFIALK